MDNKKAHETFLNEDKEKYITIKQRNELCMHESTKKCHPFDEILREMPQILALPLNSLVCIHYIDV